MDQNLRETKQEKQTNLQSWMETLSVIDKTKRLKINKKT